MATPNTHDMTVGHLGARYLWTPITVDLSTSTATSGSGTTPLATGLHEIECTEDCFFLQGAATVEAAATDVPLSSTGCKRLAVTGATDCYVAGIVASGTASLTITRIA